MAQLAGFVLTNQKRARFALSWGPHTIHNFGPMTGRRILFTRMHHQITASFVTAVRRNRLSAAR
jgi:hypothetical protein